MHRRPTAAAAVLLAVLSMSGCSGDDTGSDPTDATSSSPATTPDDPDASAGASGTPTDAGGGGETGVEPASGPLLDRDVVSLHAPAGWELVEASFGNQVQAKPTGSGIDTDMLLSSIPGSSTADLDDLERAALESVTEPERTRKQPRVEVGGVEMSHIVTPSLFGRQDLFTTLYGDQQVTLRINTPDGMPAGKRTALVDSVLASVEWR